jgi:hypothetical protein
MSFPKDLFIGIQNLSLSGNPFDCSCKLFWFKNWIANNKANLVGYNHSHNSYLCQDHQQQLDDVVLTPQECLTKPVSKRTWMTVAVCTSGFIITCFFSLLHRLRWHIRLWFYHLGTWLQPTRPKPNTSRHFDFDLFVSHNANDTLG